MRKVFLMGRSEAGKTSLTQALKGEELHYVKTQYTNTADDTIDSPGEYAESKRFSVGLACFSFEADVVAIVQAADEPFNLFGDSSRCFIQRPLIGIITKILVPMCKCTLFTVTLVTFTDGWNNYFWPKIIARGESHRVLTIGLAQLQNTFAGNETMNNHEIMAGAVLAVVPVIILFFIFQKYMLTGYSKAAMK